MRLRTGRALEALLVMNRNDVLRESAPSRNVSWAEKRYYWNTQSSSNMNRSAVMTNEQVEISDTLHHCTYCSRRDHRYPRIIGNCNRLQFGAVGGAA